MSGFLGQYRESGTTQEWADMPWYDDYDRHDFWDLTPLDGVNVMTWTEGSLRLPSWKAEVLYDVRVAPQYKDGTRGGFVEATAASCPRGKSYSPSLRRCVSPPSAPGGFTASAGDGAISLTWGPPPSNGGDPPSRFELRWRKLGSTKGWETRAIPWDSSTTVMNFGNVGTVFRNWHQILSGLDNAVRYEVGVSAVNRAGYSPWVQAVLAPCPRGSTYAITRAACNVLTDPGKPRNFTLTSGNGRITASWEAPADTGGSRIISYIIRWNKVGSDETPQVWLENAPSQSEITTIAGLSNTEHYWVEVAARNLLHQGDYIRLTSAPCAGAYNPATKKCATKPRPPEGLYASSGDGKLRVHWNVPSDDGGSPITSYKITWKEEGTTNETSATVTASEAELSDTLSGETYTIWAVTLPFPSTLPALKNNTLYEVEVSATNAVGTGYSASIKSMPCPAGSARTENGECAPECGRGEEYNETEGGCRPSDDFCEGNPNLSLARDSSGYCEYAWAETPAGNGITYELVDCDQPSEFSATANADTYINTNIAGKDLTTDKNPMCPPTGLFLALGERRRHHNPTDYYHPEWATEDDLKKDHGKVIVRASGDCTGLSDVLAVESGVLAACQAHDYCYDLIRSGLHQTVQEGGKNGCDAVLRKLWLSYCGTLSWWREPWLKLSCIHAVDLGDVPVRLFATTPPEAGIVVLRNSKTGKCLTLKPKSTTLVTTLVQEHCRFNDNHKPNDEGQWFHVLQAEPFTNAASGPTEAGYFYVMPANVNPAEKDSWKKSLSSQETEVEASRCLYVSRVSRTKVREVSCMVSGVRLSSRVFQLVNTSVADEYGIRSVWDACWQPKAGEDDAETAADGVPIISVSSASGCGAVLQSWRIEPVDPNVIVGKSS